MKKSICLVLSLCFCILMMFTACGGSEDFNKLEMWAGGSQWTGVTFEKLKGFIDEYNKTKPAGYEIDLKYKSDPEAEMAAALRSGKQPDLIIWDRFITPQYVKDGFLAPVDKYIEEDKVDTSVYHPEALKEMTYNGKTYGLPLDLDTWGVYVNTTFVDEYNATAAESDKIVLSENWTWGDMLAIAKKLEKKNGNTVTRAGYSSGDLEEHFYKFMVSTGTEYLINGKTNFRTPQAEAVLNFFKEVRGSINSSGLQEDVSFTSGLIAMMNKPTYYCDYIAENAPANFRFKFMPQPKYSGNGGVNGGMIGGFGIAFPQALERFKTATWEAKNAAAWDFAKWWLTDEENVVEWSKASNTLPAITSVYDNAIIQDNNTLASAARYVSNYKIRPQVPGYLNLQINVVNTTIKRFFSNELNIGECINALTNSGDLELA